jgi:hypothetical protein
MIAALSSAIGIVAAGLFSSIYFSVQRMDAGFARLEGRIDRLEIRMDQGFSRLDARLDTTNARLDAHIHPHTG